ncbi:hypothetical protein GIB67_004443, partial [Kingdonia uniflora]
MDRRSKRESYTKDNKLSISQQKQMVESRKPLPKQPDPVPDLTELMDEWFFGGAVEKSIKPSVIARGPVFPTDYEEEITSPSNNNNNNNNSRLTQEWLQEAKRMVASSPSRCESPSRLIGSPRFVAANAKDFDRRDPLSRSARRHRSVKSFSDEILSKSAKHTRNKSETFPQPQIIDSSPASTVHQWFSNLLKPSDPAVQDDPTFQTKPPRLPTLRTSRFRDDPAAAKPIPSRRTFKNTTPANVKPTDTNHNHLVLSSLTCTPFEPHLLSPPKNLVESAHRRSISSSTCSLDKIKVVPTTGRLDFNARVFSDGGVNEFLKEQRTKIGRISKGEIDAKAKIVLSGASNSTSSMVAAICYAWLLETKNKAENGEDGEVVVLPVMNMKRGKMWKQRQASWLFYHVGIDANALIFSDEVDLESLMMAKQLSILVVGQDVLQTNGEVGSQCTILTDNYCEDAYDLLQTPVLRKLLLSGILLDTQCLESSTKFSMQRDAEAVQLLLVGSAPNYRSVLYDQLMQDQQDGSFLEALDQNYGKPITDSKEGNRAPKDPGVLTRNSTSISNQGTTTQTHASNKNHMSDTKGVKTNIILPKSANNKQKPVPIPVPAPVPTAAPVGDPSKGGKNKFSLA